MAPEQLTSYQIGKLIHVSRQAVNQWIDKGLMPAFRTPGGHRRVQREDVVVFLKERGMPVPEVLQDVGGAGMGSGPRRIALLSEDSAFVGRLQPALSENLPDVELRPFTNACDALLAIGQSRPDLIIADTGHLTGINGLEMCRRLKANDATRDLPLVIIASDDAAGEASRLPAVDSVRIYAKSESASDIAEGIRQLLVKRG